LLEAGSIVAKSTLVILLIGESLICLTERCSLAKFYGGSPTKAQRHNIKKLVPSLDYLIQCCWIALCHVANADKGEFFSILIGGPEGHEEEVCKLYSSLCWFISLICLGVKSIFLLLM
jgi:hypothetical protein